MTTENKTFECCDCGWTGSHDDKGMRLETPNGVKEWVDVCPDCKHDTFYIRKS